MEIKNLEEIIKLKGKAVECVKGEILLNKCICHLKLEQFDDIIKLGIRAINTSVRYENKKFRRKCEKKLLV